MGGKVDYRTIKSRYRMSKSGAKVRNLEFSISRENYADLISKACFYCGGISLGLEIGVGLDRIDNKKGYVEGNVVQCCKDCNWHRHTTWTLEEMKVAIEAVLKYRASRK